MTSQRKISLLAGTLFILATAASLTATGLLPSLTGPDYLGGVADHSGGTATAALLVLVAAGCSLGIAVALYAVLHRTQPTLALGGVVFRAIEAVFYGVGALSLLTVLSIATATPEAGGEEGTRLLGDALVSAHDRSQVAAVSAFVVGGLLYYLALYRTRLIPRWLSGWGLLAMPLMAVACGLALYQDQPVTHYVALALPIGVQEIVLAVWLLAKGFADADPAATSCAGTPGS
jgi:hypothetical protein